MSKYALEVKCEEDWKMAENKNPIDENVNKKHGTSKTVWIILVVAVICVGLLYVYARHRIKENKIQNYTELMIEQLDLPKWEAVNRAKEEFDRVCEIGIFLNLECEGRWEIM